MSNNTQCRTCGQMLRLPHVPEGKKLKCPSCNGVVFMGMPTATEITDGRYSPSEIATTIGRVVKVGGIAVTGYAATKMAGAASQITDAAKHIAESQAEMASRVTEAVSSGSLGEKIGEFVGNTIEVVVDALID